MLRYAAQLLLVLAPLGGYVWWLLVYVRRALAQGEGLHTVAMMLGGLLVLVVVEGVLFKLYLLPAWARGLSERLYGGSYLPEDDPLAMLARKMEVEKRPELLPELIRLVEADPFRARAWLELARVLQGEDPAQAAKHLQRGAEMMAHRHSRSSQEDAALLLWRAAMLLQKHAHLAPQAQDVLQQLADRYPNTAYGKLATGAKVRMTKD